MNFLRKHKYRNIPREFNKTVLKLAKNIEVFKSLNFGDRDGTTILGEQGSHINNNRMLLNNDKFFLVQNCKKYVFIRKQNWTNFGTEGHLHCLLYTSPRPRD